MRGRCNHATSLHSKKGIREIVRADEENDSASQSVVERRRQGTQSAFESSNTSREDRQNEEADRRCAQAQCGNSRYWPRPRSVAFRRQSRPSLDQRFSATVWRRRVHLRSSPALHAENLALPYRAGCSLTIDPITRCSGPRGEMLRNRPFATPLAPRSCHPLQTVRQLIQPPIARKSRC
jgi:hypothetical protein